MPTVETLIIILSHRHEMINYLIIIQDFLQFSKANFF